MAWTFEAAGEADAADEATLAAALQSAVDAAGCINAVFVGRHEGKVLMGTKNVVPPTFQPGGPNRTPLANTVAPVVTGTLDEGDTLTSSTGTWVGDAPITFAYQWHRADDDEGLNDAAISGATASTRVLAAADATKFLRCKVTATETEGGQTASAFSAYVGPVVGA